ncbi:MAG: hypothetical protein D6706_05515 [Chloroflexi bacterium]|nr:MAG: hypothetical protein D6706_05515 [Chloroflexota bacterium]
MRFIIKEQPYEKPLMAGMWRYEQNGRSTGAVEHWRLSSAPDGYRFLRVDLDARAAESGHTYLYHALLDQNGRIERLKYRFWGRDLRISGDIIFESDSLTESREVNGIPESRNLALPAKYGVWFPSAEGLGLAAYLPGITITAVTLDNNINGPSPLAAQVVEFTHYMIITDYMEEDVAGEMVLVSPRRLMWNGHTRMVYLRAEDGRPVKMVRDDGLTAVLVRYIQYK